MRWRGTTATHCCSQGGVQNEWSPHHLSGFTEVVAYQRSGDILPANFDQIAFEHHPSLDHYLPDCAYHLKPGGVLLLVTSVLFSFAGS